jgi:hypothetical protein
MLLAHLIFSIGIGGFAIFRVFRDASSYYQDCLHSYAGSSSQSSGPSICADGVKIIKGVAVSLFVVLWLFEICASDSLIKSFWKSSIFIARGMCHRQQLLQAIGCREVCPGSSQGYRSMVIYPLLATCSYISIHLLVIYPCGVQMES